MNNMNYELAKQLKEAGFTQILLDRNYAGFKEKDTYVDGVYFPNLSELIEACGDKFWCLMQELEGWSARQYNNPEWTIASTPEEAVANLWLELNKGRI
jgi:hypothetical protein